MIVEDMQGNKINSYMIGQIARGDITDPIPLRLYNNSDKPERYLVKAVFSIINHRGLPIDTVNSTFISLDMLNPYPELIVDIPADSKLLIYLEYQPTWIALVGVYQWSLIVEPI